jgi:ectoine hydroxylase-related dioxygenase (phytanoyl-CoA dioxygenase family)
MNDLSPEQIAAFREDGFLVLPDFAPIDELQAMQATFERLFRERVGWEEGAHFDLAGVDEQGRAPRLPQILKPTLFAPALRENRAVAQAAAIARQLLGPEAVAWFDHAILKPPGHGAATPWHQDEAHRDDPGTHYEQISVWLPLQAATEANGCMRFIPGSHHGPVLDHRSLHSDPRIMALECVAPFDATKAVACPLPLGSASVHHARTLHGAGANVSDAPRFAYILAFRGPARPDPSFTGYAWNREKRTAAHARREAWKSRGGALGRAVRWARQRLERKVPQAGGP